MATKLRTTILVTSLFIAVALVAAYIWTFPSGTLRYRMTVEVQADGELYTGSAVHEVTYRHMWGLMGHPISSDFRGEAVAVDVADRGTLFVLLTGPCVRENVPISERPMCEADPQELAIRFFDLDVGSPNVVRSLNSWRGSAEVNFTDLPMLVQFGDVTDPGSVELVDPTDLTASFGSGVYLKMVQIESTHNVVTSGIADILPWNEEYRSGMLDGRLTYNGSSLANSIHLGNFSRGVLSR